MFNSPALPIRRASGRAALANLVRLLTSIALVLTGLVVIAPTAARAADGISFSKASTGSVLLGGTAEFTLTATNPVTGVEQYNLSFTDVLPEGVKYVAPTSPANFGEPQVIDIPADPTAVPEVKAHQVLVWTNVSDLTPGSSQTLTFKAKVDPDIYGIDDTVHNTGGAWVSDDPRIVPEFDKQGVLVPDASGHVTGKTGAGSTTVTAIRIEKSEPSAEGELLRGVNDHQTVFSLRVTNNFVGPTSDLKVTDYLPAGLEFLGCPGPFNSTTPEYPGAKNVVSGPIDDCLDPDSVETVELADDNDQGYPAGVYTKVIWTIGGLDAKESTTINYAAGIPQRANSMDWGEATGPAAASGEQAANLDNNNGPSTRETRADGELSLTNRAEVGGVYAGDPVADTSRHTVTAEDLRILKSVDPDEFTQGKFATYTLDIATSEYVDASSLLITDRLPAGLCPVRTSDAGYTPPSAVAAECAINQGDEPTNASIVGVEPNLSTGDYKLTIKPNDTALAANGHLVITYQAKMRANFRFDTNSPTSSLDDFTNSVSIAGTTQPRADKDVNPPEPDGEEAVSDISGARIASTGPGLVKLRMPNATRMQCSDDAGDYADAVDLPAAEAPFTEGDRVCFLLKLDFPGGVDTRNVQLTDFLPTNMTYESSVAIVGGDLVRGTVVNTGGNSVVWTLGRNGSSPLVVPKASKIYLVVSATVAKPVALTGTPQALDKDNLAKLRYTNSINKTQSLRDAISVPLGPPPPIGISKGVQKVNGTTVPGGDNQGGHDGDVVRGTDKVTFRIDVANLANAGDVNADTIASPEVWDVLPAGIKCTDASDYAPATCYDADDPSRPNLSTAAPWSGYSGRSLLVWKLDASFTLAPVGATGSVPNFRTVTYAITIPAEVSVSTRFENVTAVAAYTSATNIDDGGTPPVAVHNPANNISAANPSTSWDVPEAKSDSYIVVPDAAVDKSLTTSITDDPYNGTTDGTAGEGVTYTIDVTIPAHTTVYQGLLSDPLPTGLTFVGPATLALVGGSLPDAVSLVDNTVSGSVQFGNAASGNKYVNDTNADQIFRVTIPARVNNTGVTHNQKLVNVATFTSNTAVDGSAIPARTDNATLTVVLPSPSITKSRTPSAETVAGGQALVYTLTARNAASRPILHDTVVTDCVPAGIVVGTTNPTVGVTVQTNACGTGNLGTLITWQVDSIAANTAKVLTYNATITGAAGAQSYTNTAGVTGSSLDDGTNGGTGSPNEGVYTAATSNTVKVSGAGVTKTANPQTLTIGERGSFTVKVTLPPNLDFYDSLITDSIPAGFVVGGLTTDSVSCTGFAICPTLTPLSSNPALPGAGAAAVVGWGVGDVAAATVERTISVTYSITLADLTGASGNRAGTTRQNTAVFGWNLTDKNTPPAVTATLDRTASGPATVTVVEPAIIMGKAVSNPTPAPDDIFTYTVSVTNNGRADNLSPAFNVIVEDTVPVGVVVDADTISGLGALSGAGVNGGGKITWTIPGPLNPGADNAVQFTYQATLAASGTLSGAGLQNSVNATHYESLASGGRTTYSATPATATVTPQFPHVTPSKSVATGPAYLGQPKTWTITLTSDGKSTAYDVDATDTLPMNWSFVDGSATVVVAGNPATPANFAKSTDASGKQVLTWTNVGDLAVGQTAVITFTAVPKDPDAASNPGVGATVDHTNTVATLARDHTGATSSGAGDYHGAPATASTQIHSADLQVTKTSDHNAVAGEKLTYTLTVKNNGPDPAVGGFTVTDTLPSGYAASVTSASGWICSESVGTIRCNRDGTLAKGDSLAPITVELTIPAGTPGGTELINRAAVSGTTYDPNLDNNQDSVTDHVTHEIDLGIVKKTASAVVAGAEVTYTLDVRNYGPSDSTGPVRVTDPLPSGTTFVSAAGATAGEWSCDLVTGVITCDRTGALAANAVAGQIVVKVRVASDQTGNLVNRATVAGPAAETDINPGNNSSQVTDPIATSADLQLQKEHVGKFTAGSPGTYKFTIYNDGPSDAAGPLRLADTLPAGVSYDSVLTSGWNCAVTAAGFDCNRTAGLAAKQTTVLEVQVNLDSSLATATSILNTATVTSATPDPHLPNNTDTDDALIDRANDLAITKTHTPKAPIEAGSNTQVEFTLQVRNHGPSDDAGVVTVSDTLPVGFVGITASGTGWDCDVTGRLVTCTLSGALGADESATPITVKASVAADAGPATLTNIASVTTTSGTPDTDPSNNTARDDVTVIDRAELTISKVATDDTIVAGGKVIYTVTVHNAGPSDADNVVVADELPAGLTLVKVTAVTAGVSCNDANPVDCRKAVLAAGAFFSFTVEATVGAGVPDETKIDNTATVTTATPEGNPDDNSDTETITVYTEADLSIEKSHQASSVIAGEQTAFDLKVKNAGLSDALAPIRVVDRLPAGMTFVQSTGDWICVAAEPTDTGQEVTCILNGAAGLLAGATAPALSITVLVASELDPEALVEGELVNQASVDSPTTDPSPQNNSDTDAIPVKFDADLSIAKTHTGPVRVGDELSFTLVVANAGSSVARGVKVSDPLPTGLKFVSAAGEGWTCAADAATCTLDADLAAGATAKPITVRVLVLASAYPKVTNVAKVDAATPDSKPDNNQDSDEVVVPPQVDLGITKSHVPEPMQVGGQATYTLTVTNSGPTPDPGPIRVLDTLPVGLSFVRATGDGWTCSAVGQDVTCVRASALAVDGTATITLVVDVLPAAYPAVLNTASVSSPAEDLKPENNQATDPATVLPLYNLGITKELAGQTSDRATWTITVDNAGPNPAPNGVTVVDNLPGMLSYASYSGEGWTCAVLGQAVTCDHPAPIAAGESVAFTLVTTIDPDFSGTVVNSAGIVGGDSDDAEAEVPDANDSLAFTGGAAIGAGLLGVALLGGGALLLVLRRRRLT